MKNWFYSLIGFLLILSFESCSNTDKVNSKTITLVYVAWDGEIAATNVMKVVLEKLGYRVDINSVSTPVMYNSLASGQADAMLCAWLPTADQFYWKNLKDKVDDRGSNFEGTYQGFVVPSYVSVDSLSNLKNFKDKFKSEIIGIDSGAGTMIVAEKALEHYGLNQDFRILEGSTATMLASLKEAIRKKEWIIITGWSPHWMWKRFDLKYLEDPDKIMGNQESVHTLVRSGLKKDFPEVYEVFSRFHWTQQQMLPLLLMNSQGGDAYENAKVWVNQNKDLVLSWIPDEMKDKLTW